MLPDQGPLDVLDRMQTAGCSSLTLQRGAVFCFGQIQVSVEPVSRLFWPELAVCSLLSSAAVLESDSQTSLLLTITTEPFLRRRVAKHTHVVL